MMNYIKAGLKRLEINRSISEALKEDIGTKDITTGLVIPEDKYIRAILLAKEDCVVCGLEVARRVFKMRDKNIKLRTVVRESQRIKKGKVIARLQGKAGSILTAERVALNFLSLLSGIATKTREFVDKVKPYKIKIMDTRKTMPGLRTLEKYAVRTGGGYNHRFRLDEMVLIKDNHLKVIGNRSWVIGLKEFKNKISPKIKIEIEVKTLEQFRQALKIKPNAIMLDNMKIKDIREAVRIRNNLLPAVYNPQPKLEVSGGITLENVRGFASTGVDMISIGELTHSARSIDLSLEVL